jgi:pimeloyl-ACP methyl ester carboxylesterase
MKGNPVVTFDKQVVEPPEVELASQYWQWRGWRVHYTHQGQSGPNLLLIHGFGASTDHWRKNVVPLSDRYRVWAIDLLGFGRSQKPEITYTAELWRDQLQAFCQEVIQAPVFVAGNSVGGYAALCFGVDCPAWTKGVILLNCAGPFTPAPEEASSKPAWQQHIATLQRQFFQLPGVIDLLSLGMFYYMRQRSQIRKVLLQVYKDPTAVTDQLVEEIYRPAFDQGALWVFGAVFKSPSGRKLDVLLQALSRPLFLIWGAADPWMTPTKAHKFLDYAPEATLELVDAGHCPHDERPEVVNALLDHWIQQQTVTVTETLTEAPTETLTTSQNRDRG